MAQYEWTYIPTFGDSNAKINVSTNEKLNAKVVEVLYGARNEQGGSIAPESEADGHGKWVALESNGKYQLISWVHPASEGGVVEAGRYDDVEDALADLEASIAQKEALIAKAEAVKGTKDTATLKAEFDGIMNEWKTTHYYHTPVEDELFAKYQAAKQAAYDDARSDVVEKKESIITRAKEVVENADWNGGKAKLDALLDEWKTSGFAGKEKDDELWAKFNEARNNFFATRKTHFASMNKENEKLKKAVIAKAKAVEAKAENFKNNNDVMQELMTEWKKIGNAGKAADDSLWAEFNTVRQDFYAKRTAYYKDLNEKITTSINAKKELIAEAKKNVEAKDYSKAISDQMKQLQENWKSTGRAGKQNDSLWAEFKALQDQFWQEKSESAATRHDEWVERQKGAINRKRKQIDALWKEVKDLKASASNARNRDEASQSMAKVQENYEKIKELESQVGDIERKL